MTRPCSILAAIAIALSAPPPPVGGQSAHAPAAVSIDATPGQAVVFLANQHPAWPAFEVLSQGIRKALQRSPQRLAMYLLEAPPSSLWRDYRAHVIAAAAIGVLQTVFIAWLLVEHRRRRRAELELGQRLQEAHRQLVTITHLERRAAMGELTAAITHELNQPLEAILHNAEAGELMLESGTASQEEVRRIFADIRRIDMRAAEIIQRLRRLLRRKEFEARALEVNDLAREALALVMPVAGARGVRIELDLASDVVPIVGDRIHLQQVLLNLLLNAIDAMGATPRERRRLAVRTRTTDDHVEISVRDCGHGIRAETVSRIFEPFYTTKGEGMGIGLAIARTIVEAHGGRIAARNNADGGATVWFTVPSGAAARGSHAPTADRQSASGALDAMEPAPHLLGVFRTAASCPSPEGT